eukprot:TRINITY_DN9574_c0_g1_i5.p1 TRINITY_DN9574_c0_g1~~TRINITY_DN9574_c0_g1_i5.p1  ORF type:complete len:583 (+),score=64.03 TRINITY_DN9574_c0_g1_i5:54-1751(+)
MVANDSSTIPLEIRVAVSTPSVASEFAENSSVQSDKEATPVVCAHGDPVESKAEVNLFELRNSGFLLQFFAIGIVFGGLPATVYGLFLGYLNVPAYVYAAAAVITRLPWSFKFIWGLINDCVPIRGQRRRPYMVFGWTLCSVTLLALGCHPLPQPYYCRGSDGKYLKRIAPCNPDAQHQGGMLASLMCLAALGYVIADVAADGLMVEYAHREPEERRGKTQTTVYITRTLGMIVAVTLVAFGMNGKEYNGSFDWTLSFNQICFIFAIPVTCMIPVSYFLVVEERIKAHHTFREYVSSAWELLTNKAFFYVVMYQFWEPFIGRISTPAGGLVKKEWAGVQNLQNQLFTLVSLFLFTFALWLVKKRFLNASWRRMLFTTAVFLNVTDSLFSFATIFDVVRNQYFYLGETIIDEIPTAVNFVVSTFIIVEMASKGNEGMVYGLLTTIANLGSPFSRAVGNQFFGLFRPSLSDADHYIEDTPAFRKVVALSFGISYAFSFISLIFLILLPSQKGEAQRRKQNWPRRQAYGYITIGLLLGASTYSLAVNIMTMIPETSCLQLVGGPGCDS